MRRTSLTQGRRRAERCMVDTCVVTRVTGETTDDDGAVVVTREQVYEGKAKRQTYEGYEQTPNSGGHTFTVQRYSTHFPVGSFKPQVGDLIEWVACPMDPDREGTQDRITALFNKSLATAQRVFVDELVE